LIGHGILLEIFFQKLSIESRQYLFKHHPGLLEEKYNPIGEYL